MAEELKIIHYPDPRLKKISAPVEKVDPQLKDLAAKMLELMREAKGVGLAAPQVGKNIRLFVMNPTGEPNDNRVYVNPMLSDPEGDEASEEGCLSLPQINAQISRNKSMRMQAVDLEGNKIDLVESGYVARIWQHEYDHLNGVLIIDRMGLGDKMKYRKALREMEEKWDAEHPKRKPPEDDDRKDKKKPKRPK